MGFPKGMSWPAWQRDYRYGALVIEPPRQLASVLDAIRLLVDPVSANRVGAHITLTPPFAAAPNSADEERVASVIRGVASMRLQLDRPTQFSGSSVVYLPVEPIEAFDKLRAMLVRTGLFRLDLPHTDDFVPHLTLSEFGTAPMEALGADVPSPEAMSFLAEAVAWAVPDEAFHFTVRRTFPLDSVGGPPDREDEEEEAIRGAGPWLPPLNRCGGGADDAFVARLTPVRVEVERVYRGGVTLASRTQFREGPV